MFLFCPWPLLLLLLLQDYFVLVNCANLGVEMLLFLIEKKGKTLEMIWLISIYVYLVLLEGATSLMV